MKLIPVMTEKSMKQTKDRGYTFRVPMFLTKADIKAIVEKTFGVHVLVVRTINSKPSVKRNTRGQMQKVKAVKKAIVFVKEGEKIELFEEEKKTKKVKKGKNEKA